MDIITSGYIKKRMHMKFIGISTSHDAGYCVINEDGEVETFCQLERVVREKRTGVKRPSCTKHIIETLKTIGKDDIICNVEPSIPHSFFTIMDKPNAVHHNMKNFYYVSHHIAHALSGWMYRLDDSPGHFAAYDGRGPYFFNGIHNLASLFGEINESGIHILEEDPIYSSERLSAIKVSKTQKSNVCRLQAGKLMGLAGYHQERVEFEFPESYEAFKRLRRKIGVDYKKNPVLAASFYDAVVGRVQGDLFKMLDKYDVKNLTIGGGSGLALEINTNLYDRVGHFNFPPAIDDSGLALGTACYAYFMHTGKWPKPLKDGFQQWLPAPHEEKNPLTPQEMAKKLNDQTVIGLVRGKAEIGPRALGHRSFIADPRTKDMYDLVSGKIKNRESYRPIAPIVTEKAFDELFTGPKGRYMQYKCMGKEGASDVVPAVIHVDNSSRPQVIYEKDDPYLYNVLVEFGKLSGIECLINTSLNTGGKPIANTLADAEFDCKGLPVEIVCFN
jgi:predicted NodU family carbamoyl transferase